AQHVAEVVRPALARGALVVSDRYTPSTLAYQGVGRGLGVEIVDTLNGFATDGLEPDLVLVLDVPDDVAEARIPRHRGRVERGGRAFQPRVRAAYRELAPVRGGQLADGSGSPAEVATRVRDAVTAILP